MILEKDGSGSARGDGERWNADPAYSSGACVAASGAGGFRRICVGIKAGSGPRRSSANTAGSQVTEASAGRSAPSPFGCAAGSDSPRRRMVTCPMVRRGLAGCFGEPSLLRRSCLGGGCGLEFLRAGEERRRQSRGRSTSVPMVARTFYGGREI